MYACLTSRLLANRDDYIIFDKPLIKCNSDKLKMKRYKKEGANQHSGSKESRYQRKRKV